MTWRRFMVLVAGLSPNSATVAHMTNRRYMGMGKQQVTEITTPEAAQRAFETLFKRPTPEKPH